jgi:hypothetical protein
MISTRLLVVLALLVAPCLVVAKGSKGAPAPGTGSKASSTHVKGHVKKDGTYVAPHQKSTPDSKFENNWTTKGNDNLYTGKDGTKVSEPPKK